jgi:hypothetical protein
MAPVRFGIDAAMLVGRGDGKGRKAVKKFHLGWVTNCEVVNSRGLAAAL